MESIWTETQHNLKDFEKPVPREAAAGDITTDVCVIGGGMAGILIAYYLKNAGVDCLVVEAAQVGSGVTRNTTAKISAQHGLLYSRLLSDVGTEGASQYLYANELAVEEFRRLCADIPCDFENRDNYVFSTDDTRLLEQEAAALEQLHYKPLFTNEQQLPFRTAGLLGFQRQAQFNPLKFLFALAAQLKIYEGSQVLKLKKGVAIGKGFRIHAKTFVSATHFPLVNTRGLYWMRLYQNRSYVLAVDRAVQVPGMYISQYSGGLSLRQYGDCLLVGSGGHRTGVKGPALKEARHFLRLYAPQSREICVWAAQDCMSLDNIPYIGSYSGRSDDLLVATGFNKWGMTGSMVSAMLLCDRITGRDNPNAEVFSPKRSMLKTQLLVNMGEAVVSLATPTTKRCSHMGCALHWNAAEHSWDCPCHGSRFNTAQQVLDNPAKKPFGKH